MEPQWAPLLVTSIGRAEAAKRVSQPLVDLVPSDEIRTTLVLLHGRAERPQIMIDRCAPLAGYGCRLIALHSPEPYASNKFGWPLEDCEQAVIDQIATAHAVHAPIHLGFDCTIHDARRAATALDASSVPISLKNEWGLITSGQPIPVSGCLRPSTGL